MNSGDGGQQTVGGILVELAGKRIGLLNDFEVQIDDAPTVDFEDAVKPRLPMLVQFQSPPLNQTGDFSATKG